MSCEICKGKRWVCENHPEEPWDGKCCNGAGMPCECNLEAENPPDFIEISPNDERN